MPDKTHTVDIDQLVNFLDSLGSSSGYLIQKFEGNLFHYTDLGALASIIRNNDLWLSDARYSNDEHEMTHGYELAQEVLSESFAVP